MSEGHLNRRELLRRAVVAGGIAWTAPVLTSVTQPAAAFTGEADAGCSQPAIPEFLDTVRCGGGPLNLARYFQIDDVACLVVVSESQPTFGDYFSIRLIAQLSQTLVRIDVRDSDSGVIRRPTYNCGAGAHTLASRTREFSSISGATTWEVVFTPSASDAEESVSIAFALTRLS